MAIRTVRKNLAGMQDLLTGVGTQEQSRDGVDYTIAKVDVPYAVNSIAERDALDTDVYTRCRVYNSPTSFTDYAYVDTTWESVLVGAPTVATLADLQSAVTADFVGGETRNLAEITSGSADGYHVIFRNSDVSAQVAANPSKWVVPSDRAANGSAGAWERSAIEPADIIPSATTKVFAPKKALFAFHFDGPYIANFTTLLDKADELGVPVCIGSINALTNGAVGGKINDAAYGYVGQLIDAHRRGHEIYNHGFTGSINLKPGTTVTETLQDFWINYSHDWLQSLGINAQMWVTSNGGGVVDQTAHLDPQYIPKILEKHSVAFGRTSSPWNDANGFLGASFGAGTLVNQEGLTRANIEGASLSAIEDFIDYCIANKRVAVFHAHDAGNAAQLTVAEFEDVVNLIHSKGYKVTTSQDVFASFTNLFSDDATASKAANATALDAMAVVQENLLDTTDLSKWVLEQSAGFGSAAVLSNSGASRLSGEQFSLAVSDPTIIGSTYTFKRIISRPLNRVDVATLCLAIEASSSSLGDFGVECVAEFFTGTDGTGTIVGSFRKGRTINTSIPFDLVSTYGTNFFTYNTPQSVKLRYVVSNKTTWAGTKSINIFNPRLNRGSIPAPFFKKKIPFAKTTVWTGNVGAVGVITLDTFAHLSEYVKIEVGVNNTSNDVRGSVLMSYNTHDNRTIRAWSMGGGTYTDFVVRFNSPTELEILSETVVGGGDFAILGVYKYS